MFISRRSLLKSTGVTSLAAALLRADEVRGAGSAPQRFLIVWTPNGVQKDAWGADGTETDFTYREILAPFEPHKKDLLTFQIEGNGGQHSRSCSDSLTCTKPTGPNKHQAFANGISIDQYVANHIGADTRLKSLELGARTDIPLGNKAEAYNRICYAGPQQHLPMQDDPYAVFEAAFGTGIAPTPEQRMQLEARLGADRSVIDYAKNQFDALKAKLGMDHRKVLDFHLEHLRELEKLLSRPPGSAQACGSPLDKGDRIDHKADANLPLLIKMQMDIAVAAFSCDVTRVATLMITRGSRGLPKGMPWIGVNREHHKISHDNVHPDLVKIGRYYSEQVSYLVQKLKDTPDVDGRRMIDNTLLLFTNELAEGNHNRNAVPNVLAGHAAGFRMGRHLGELKRGSYRYADMMVSIANSFGIQSDKFGEDSQGPLSVLT